MKIGTVFKYTWVNDDENRTRCVAVVMEKNNVNNNARDLYKVGDTIIDGVAFAYDDKKSVEDIEFLFMAKAKPSEYGELEFMDYLKVVNEEYREIHPEEFV